MPLPKRKHPRLKTYDYGHCGCYHITICTKDRRPVLSEIIPAEGPASRPGVRLYPIGRIAERYIQNIPKVYPGVILEKYVIMPNHIHLLISLGAESNTSVPTIVRSLKRMVNRETGRSIWQESFFDTVVRNDSMFQCEWRYIDENPDKWAQDDLFVSDS